MRQKVTKKQILHFLKEKKSFLKERFHVDAIALFGSYARDEATPQSGIDILIQSRVKSFRNRYRLKYYLEKEFNKEVGIGYYDSLRSFIKDEIKEELIYV